MQWSKLKQRLEDRFADCLKGRLHIYETRQRMGHHHRLGEIWITLDKKRIYSTSDFKASQLMQTHLKSGDTYEDSFDKAAAEGLAPVYQSNEMLFDSLSMSIDDMLASEAVLIRGLAISDARCGRRRLLALKEQIITEHDFIKLVFEQRLSTTSNP